MRSIFLFAFLLFSFSVSAQSPLLSELRKNYEKLSDDDDLTDDMWNKVLGKDFSEKPTLLGYRGAIRTIMASHAFNPSTKMKYFNQGKSGLELAISRAPENIELRFLRYTVQSNCPGFLGYKDNMIADRDFMLEHIDETRRKDLVLARMIASYLSQSKGVSSADKEKLNF